MIEKGRHFNPKIQPCDRLCTLCNLNEVEDEFHFIMACPYYNNIRTKLLSGFKEMYDTDHLSDKDIFLLIISTDEYDCISLVLNYVNSAFLLRSSHDI